MKKCLCCLLADQEDPTCSACGEASWEEQDEPKPKLSKKAAKKEAIALALAAAAPAVDPTEALLSLIAAPIPAGEDK